MIPLLKIDEVSNQETTSILDITQYKVTPFDTISPPIPILYVKNYNREIPLFTEDNISLIKGKAKSRKSTFLKAVITGILNNGYQLLHSSYHRNKVAVIDTEQARYHCFNTTRVVYHLTNGKVVDYYSASSLSTEQKKELVETYLQQNPDCGFIVLDNIVHFLKDFNSAQESSELNTWLLMIKNTYNCHVALVLHENGSDSGNGKAKGHLGSLLENTAEIVIRVEKDTNDNNRSFVYPSASRGAEFNKFVISQDLQGVPFLDEYDEIPTTQKKHYNL